MFYMKSACEKQEHTRSNCTISDQLIEATEWKSQNFNPS